MSLLRYLFDHNQQVIGGLLVVILATSALLAMRMVSQEKSGTASGHTKATVVDLDLSTIETAFKRVLAAQGGVGAAMSISPASSNSSSSPDSGGEPSADLNERDTKIQELAREIDRLTSELNAKSNGGGFGGTAAPAAVSGGDSGQLEQLQEKIAELEGKLTEYEIIEDDIADLSRYKEENSELRDEIEALKARVGAAGASPAAAPSVSEAVVAPIAMVEQPVPATDENSFENLEAELAALVAEEPTKPFFTPASVAVPDQQPDQQPEPETEQVAASVEAVEKPEFAEAALKEFASSVEVQKSSVAETESSSVLDESVDTEKMFDEVSTLAQSGASADDALEGSLDTDKLLAEISSLGGSQAQAPAPAPASAPDAPIFAPLPASILAAGVVDDESHFEDDLLAEFKDSNDGGQG